MLDLMTQQPCFAPVVVFGVHLILHKTYLQSSNRISQAAFRDILYLTALFVLHHLLVMQSMECVRVCLCVRINWCQSNPLTY